MAESIAHMLARKYAKGGKVSAVLRRYAGGGNVSQDIKPGNFPDDMDAAMVLNPNDPTISDNNIIDPVTKTPDFLTQVSGLGKSGGAVENGLRISRKYASGGPVDTGMNIPETPESLQAQQDQLLRGLRAAQMFPNGTPELNPNGASRVQ